MTVLQSTMSYPQMDIMTWLFERQFYPSKDTDEVFINAENPQIAITRGQAKRLAQQIGASLFECERIVANGLGEDVVVMYSSNQVQWFRCNY